jgi:GT2 family glycosyltransferase
MVVDLGVNRGFAGGCAVGRTAASGEYLALLHDDAVAAPDWLGALIGCASEHHDAAVTGRVVFGDGRLQSTGCILWRDGTTTQIGYGEPDERERHDRRRLVDYGSRRCSNQSLYPAYYVDLDLAMALRRVGTTVVYEPLARTTHHQWTTASAPVRDVAVAVNRARFLHKWGDQLADQEIAPERGDAVATARAVTRALARCAARPRGWTPPGQVGPPSPRRSCCRTTRSSSCRKSLKH